MRNFGVMMMEAVSYIVLGLIVLSFYLSLPAMFVAGLSSFAFGALAAVPPSAVGGVTLTVTSAAFGALFLRVLYVSRVQELVEVIFSVDRIGILTIFILYSVAMSALLPWIFEGLIYIYPLRPEGSSYSLTAVSYSASNITQSFYLILSWSAVVSTFILSGHARFRVYFSAAFYVLSGLIVATGVIDLLGGNEFLSVFRNASYALVGDSDVGSFKRVVGAMPEASTFGASSAGVFSILVLCRGRFDYPLLWMVSAIGTGAFSVLSTSSTAYGMLAVACIAFMFQCIFRLLYGERRERVLSAIELLLCCLAGLLMIEIVLYFDELSATMVKLLNDIVFNKSSSSSFEERSRWTSTTYEAFKLSYGLGIGLGTARTSNGFVNVLASTGAVGTTLILLFLAKLIWSARIAGNIRDNSGVMLSLLPILAGFFLASPTADFGILAGILFGLQSRLNS